MSVVANEHPGTPPGGFIAGIGRRATSGGVISQIVVPVAAVAAALVVGGALIALDGTNAFSAYREVLRAVFVGKRGLSDTATAATPLILIGLGYSIAYRARVFTIGGEGQYLIGAIAGTAWVTAGGIRTWPGFPLVLTGLIVAAIAGAAWSGIAGLLEVRFGANVVISSLMLVYVAGSVLQWAVRTGIRDPDSFVPNSRPLLAAQLPRLPGTSTHVGFAIAMVLVPIAAVFMARHRGGFRVIATGFNPNALDANEISKKKIVVLVMVIAGALAGLAGMIETAGSTGRLGAAASVGFGFEAIIVAMVGRLHPIGVAVAALGLAGLTIGFESTQRVLDVPSTLVGVITALIVVVVVIGDALANRGREGR